MRIHRSILAPCTAVLLGAQAQAGLGYLPVAGPAPLRFSAPQPAPAALPAFPAEDKKAEGTPVPSPVLSSRSAPVPDLPSTLPPPEAASNPPQGVSSLPVPEPPVLPMIPPEVLVQVFTEAAGTNRAMAVTVPVPFQPALAVPPPSSRATYSLKPRP